MQIKDTLYPFLFVNVPVRGNLACMSSVFEEALEHQSMPLIIKQALGELMMASALMISTLKMQGKLILQMQGHEKLKLLVVECNTQMEIRATAHWEGSIEEPTFSELVKTGQFVITLSPAQGEPYQGIVALQGQTIAEMLENYMQRSQQIDTKLILHSDAKQVTGMLLQRLPDQSEGGHDDWERLIFLSSTVTHQEIAEVPANTLLHQLFHEDDIRLFDGRPMIAKCSCSQAHVANMLKLLGLEEVNSIIEEQGSVDVHCDFCNKRYVFDEDEVKMLFEESDVETRH